MDVVGLNRVELVIDQARIHDAVQQFNEAFGLRLPDPIDIAGHGALSATDFAGGLEFIAPAPDDTTSSVGRRLAEFGEGQLGPLVFQIRDVEAARSWLESRGFRIRYEYDSRQGNADEVEMSVHQLHLDPEQWFGFNVTLMRPFEGGAAAAAVALAGAASGDDDAASRERNKQAVRAFVQALGPADGGPFEVRSLTAEQDRVAAVLADAAGAVSHHLFELDADGRTARVTGSRELPAAGPVR